MTRTILPLHAIEHIEDFLLRWREQQVQPTGHTGARLIVDLNLDRQWLQAECDRVENVAISRELLARNPEGPVADRIRAALRRDLLPESVKFEVECLEAGIAESIHQPLLILGSELCEVIESLATATGNDREVLLIASRPSRPSSWCCKRYSTKSASRSLSYEIDTFS